MGRDDIHDDEGVGGCGDERMEPDNGGVSVVLEVPVDLHFVPSMHKQLVSGISTVQDASHTDFTRAAVVSVLDPCTSLTATRRRVTS